MILSAYLDGEVPERFVPEIEEAIEHDPAVRAEYDELRRLRSRLDEPTPLDETASSRRSWAAIRERIEHPARKPDVWHRRVSISLPALAAVATVVLALIGAFVWSLLPTHSSADEYVARANDVEVTIRVDAAEMEHVLQWLVDRDMLSEVSIQLPEQHFQIVGEPVFVKPAGYSSEVVQ